MTRRVAILVSVWLLTSAAASENKTDHDPATPVIGTLRNSDLDSLPYMCECEFYRGPINGSTTVFATRNRRKVALASIDGRLVTLRSDGPSSEPGCEKHVSYRERWLADFASVTLDYRATGPGEESCWYEGKMGVTVGARTTTTVVSGACGC